MKYEEKIAPLEEEMLKSLERLVKYNSVEGEALPGMPFGTEPAACLKEALTMAEEMGFSVKNMDNYCGYAEMGEGEEIIGLVAHLDIVPAGSGWDTDPFTLTRKGERVYGRGVSDDKGAAVASLYAMKLVKEMGIPLNKRVRLLLGTNEETGSKCMEYYAEHGEPITCGFTPDGYFPGIYGEKGHCTMTAYSKNTRILDLEGGFVTNAVCDHCVVKLPAGEVDAAALKEALTKAPVKHFELKEEGNALVLEVQGAAAHASTPLLGVNAASYAMKALKEAGFRDDFVEFYNSRIGTGCDGEGIGLKIGDAYGDLTLNNGIVRMKDGVISCTIDIRYPVTYTPEKIRELCAPYLEDGQGRIEIGEVGQPLFYDRNSDLVKNLHAAYREITGDTEREPMVIGGGTYAKSVPGIIAFGCEFPDTDNHIHDRNESLSLAEWRCQVAIYVEAIRRLLSM